MASVVITKRKGFKMSPQTRRRAGERGKEGASAKKRAARIPSLDELLELLASPKPPQRAAHD